MKDELVSFETADLLKQVGFSGGSFYHYYCGDETSDSKPLYENSTELFIGCEGGLHTDSHFLTQKGIECGFIAPTQSLAARWLREEKEVIIVPKVFDLRNKTFYYLIIFGTGRTLESNVYTNYEACLEAALKKALRIILTIEP